MSKTPNLRSYLDVKGIGTHFKLATFFGKTMIRSHGLSDKYVFFCGIFTLVGVLGSFQLVSVVNNHGDRKSTKDRVVPLPNGLSMAYKWE